MSRPPRTWPRSPGWAAALPQIEALGEADWVTMSQAGLQPIRAGRFFVHTPTHRRGIPAGATAFEIDAGLAFGTGQHATTAGCLEQLDILAGNGCEFTNIADVGTGTGLLAFAALSLWPGAKCIATDIDPVAIDVSRDNAAINGVTLGHGAGELLLAVADGMDSPLLAARAPFDLIIANILAGPLIELAPDFAKALAPGGTVMLAGLLDTQADAVVAAYEELGLSSRSPRRGEWPVLVLASGSRPQLLQHEGVIFGPRAILLEPARLAAVPRLHVDPEHQRIAVGLHRPAASRHIWSARNIGPGCPTGRCRRTSPDRPGGSIWS